MAMVTQGLALAVLEVLPGATSTPGGEVLHASGQKQQQRGEAALRTRD